MRYAGAVKLTDQRDAKIRLWAQARAVQRVPRIANLPHFGHRKFNSYVEFNAWKQALLDELIAKGGAHWTR